MPCIGALLGPRDRFSGLRASPIYLVLLIGVSWILVCGWRQSHAADIHLVLWRGITDAERAYMHDVVEQGLTETVKVWDAKQNRLRLGEIHRQIKAQPPDLLYLFGTTVTLAFAGRATGDQDPETLHQVPMVFDIVADPVGSRITQDYGPTGRNLTGVSHNVPLSVQAKVINDLKVTRVAALFNPMESNSTVTLEILDKELSKHQIRLTRIPVDAAGDQGGRAVWWRKIGEKLRAAGVELAYLPSDSLVISHAEVIVEGLHQAGLPTFSATEEPVSKGGALMGVISHYSAAGHHAAAVSYQILREGRDPGTIPIATPSHYLFLVNESSMKQLGYYPPIPLLRFAQFVTAAGSP